MKISLTNLFILSSILYLSSCGSPPGNSTVRDINNGTQSEISGSLDAYYVGKIYPLNHNLHFKELGLIGVEKSGDNFTVKVKMTNAPKEARISHDLYTASRCPTIDDDLNKDAFIDINEARIALGQVVVPFDDDLSSQIAGSTSKTLSALTGDYFYSNSTSYELMLSDLKDSNSIVPPYIKKIPADEELKLWGKVVLFQGINNQIELPRTIARGDSANSSNESIPMGCAVLWISTTVPDELANL